VTFKNSLPVFYFPRWGTKKRKTSANVKPGPFFFWREREREREKVAIFWGRKGSHVTIFRQNLAHSSCGWFANPQNWKKYFLKRKLIYNILNIFIKKTPCLPLVLSTFSNVNNGYREWGIEKFNTVCVGYGKYWYK